MRLLKKKYFYLFVAAFTVAFIVYAASGTGAENDGANAEFPASGLRSIFRPDYQFFSTKGWVSQESAPPARPGCGVKLFCRLEDSFAWRYKVLESSRESIRIQTYIFSADDTGKRVAGILKDKFDQGVDVRLIIDAYTKFKTPDQMLYLDLEYYGIPVIGFEPLWLLGVVNDSMFNVDDVNKRFHEKYWVIDEEVAFLGGTNIADEYARYGDDPANKWRDQDLLLTGPVVDDVVRAFEDNYDKLRRRRENRYKINQVAWHTRVWRKVTGKKLPDLSGEGAAADIEVGDMTDMSAPVRFIRSRPRYYEDYIYQAYLHLIRNAEKSILIENAYFVPNRPLISSLKEAAERGVKITVITNSEETNDVSGMQPLSRYSYLPLMEAGVEIYEWQGDHPGHGSLHSKFAVFDEQVCLIGSFNLDPRSIYLNSENVVLIDSKKVAAGLLDFVNDCDLPVSKGIDIDKAKEWHDPKNVSDKFKLQFGIALEEWY